MAFTRLHFWLTCLPAAGLAFACSSSDEGSEGGSYYRGGNIASDLAATQQQEEAAGGAGGASAVEFFDSNPYVLVQHDPLSTFAADVDTASYDYFLSQAGQGVAPPSDTVRLEEFVNFFNYDYEKPAYRTDGAPFLIHLEAAPSLVNRGSQLLRVGIQGMEVPPEDRPPTNLVYLVDASGSMGQEMSSVQALLRSTVKLLSPTDTLSIVKYASSPGVHLSATPISDTERINSAIDNLNASGSTNGAGGINAAYEQAESVFIEGGINHVLLCTDGDFNVGPSSDVELENLIIEKRKSGITLTALGFGGGNYNDGMMERISNAGNGIYGYIGSEQDAARYVEERMLQTLMHIAKDMKIQVEFNPEAVLAYRLLGYENRAIADEDFRDDLIDAGEVGSGHSVTALYEVVLAGEQIPDAQGAPPVDDGSAFDGQREVAAEDLVLVKVRYKRPGAKEEDEASEVASSLTPAQLAEGFEGAGSDLQWAAAVAGYAEILKGSPYANPSSIEAIRLVVEAQKERDTARAGFANALESLHPSP